MNTNSLNIAATQTMAQDAWPAKLPDTHGPRKSNAPTFHHLVVKQQQDDVAMATKQASRYAHRHPAHAAENKPVAGNTPMPKPVTGSREPKPVIQAEAAKETPDTANAPVPKPVIKADAAKEQSAEQSTQVLTQDGLQALLGVQAAQAAQAGTEFNATINTLSSNSGDGKTQSENPVQQIAGEQAAKQEQPAAGKQGTQAAEAAKEPLKNEQALQEGNAANGFMRRMARVDAPKNDKNATEAAATDHLPAGTPENTDTAAAETPELFSLLSPSNDADAQLPTAPKAQAQEGQKQQSPAMQANIPANTNSTAFASAVQHESAPHLTAQAAGAAGTDSTAAGQAARMRAADPAEPFEHVSPIMKGGTSLAVKLEPEGMGKLDINVSLHDGKLHTQINVQNDATRELLTTNMQKLMDTLMQEGLSVGGFNVSLQKNDNREWAAENRQAYTAKPESPSVASIASAGRPAGNGLVNLFI